VYQALPVAITVEGANILTRSLMIFGQGAMRCHPYLYDEMQTLQAEDEAAGLAAFEPLLLAHGGHVGRNLARLLVLGLTAGRYSNTPRGASPFSRRWYQRINHFSAALATCSDCALGILGGDLKRRELLSARLGDVHSELFIACSVLKFHDAQDEDPAVTAHARYAVQRSLHNAQKALLAFLDNFPQRPLALVLRGVCFPLGRVVKAPDDHQIRELGGLIMDPNPVRKALAQYVFVSDDPEDAVGRVETTYRLLLEVEEAWQAFTRARSRGELEAQSLDAALGEAAAKGVIQQEDVKTLSEYDARRYDCLLTDQFDQLV
jgi:acyl-CoA dehydrogenase